MRKRRVIAPEDVYMGERIREARIALRMTQKEVAGLLGTSYQQLQKYESGQNRITSARVGQLVSVLRRPLTYFFPNATDVRARAEPGMSRFVSTPEGHLIAECWDQIEPPIRRSIVDLITRLAKEKNDD
jgi:transcriptional regulator with XRE-family HTH domain